MVISTDDTPVQAETADNLEQFLQGSTVNLQALAGYATAHLVNVEGTMRRDELLVFIALYIKLTHNAPSQRQMGMAFNLSKTTIKQHLLKLERDGRIRILDGRLMLVGGAYVLPQEIATK